MGRGIAALAGTVLRGCDCISKSAWRDDSQQGRLVFDEPVIVHCYTTSKLIDKHVDDLRTFLVDLGMKTNQGAVGLVIDREYLEIQFPLEE